MHQILILEAVSSDSVYLCQAPGVRMGEEYDGGHLQVASMKYRGPCLSSSVTRVS